MPASVESGFSERQKCVLVVDDDLVARTSMRMILQKHGYVFVGAEGMDDAQQRLRQDGFESFDCVVTDYWMPKSTGVEVLQWVKRTDATLAVLMVSANHNKELVEESFRHGAADVLEKPVTGAVLLAAVERAVSQTSRMREITRTERAVKALGNAQLQMVRSLKTEAGQPWVDLCFYPKEEAGGDFFDTIRNADGSYCFVVADVSGHDLRAAYASAFFHGVFRGMLAHHAVLPDIFAYVNSFLVNEWNEAVSPEGEKAVPISLAVAGLILDDQLTAYLLNCGGPAPIYVTPDGGVSLLSADATTPLGWFREMDGKMVVRPVEAGGTICLWTDGLEELAGRHDVQPLSLGTALRRQKLASKRHPLLDAAQDDILFISLRLPLSEGGYGDFQPVFYEVYRGDQLAEIDQFEQQWKRNLKLAVPELDEAAEYDILLAMREAVINGLKHGCLAQPDQQVQVQISFLEKNHSLRVLIEDSGEGHDFDFAGRFQANKGELPELHRGLFFMANLSTAMKLERRGARVMLDFDIRKSAMAMV